MKKIRLRPKKFFLHAFLMTASLISLFPFYWMIVGATNSSKDITKGVLWFGSEFVNNFLHMESSGSFIRAMLNSVTIVIIQVPLTLFICSLAGYGFEKFQSKVRNRLFNMFLLTMMIPFAAVMIPLFNMTFDMNLIDTKISVIIAGLSNTFLIFFFRQSFKSFPTEIIEAARIDGCNEFYIFFRIVIPPMRSTFAAALIYAFMKEWNNYLWPLLTLQSNESKTLTMYISSLSSAYYVDYGQIMVSVVLATLPTIILFSAMQKQFVTGMLGSVKG